MIVLLQTKPSEGPQQPRGTAVLQIMAVLRTTLTLQSTVDRLIGLFLALD